MYVVFCYLLNSNLYFVTDLQFQCIFVIWNLDDNLAAEMGKILTFQH